MNDKRNKFFHYLNTNELKKVFINHINNPEREKTWKYYDYQKRAVYEFENNNKPLPREPVFLEALDYVIKHHFGASLVSENYDAALEMWFEFWTVDCEESEIDFHDGGPNIPYWWKDMQPKEVLSCIVEAYERGMEVGRKNM